MKRKLVTILGVIVAIAVVALFAMRVKQAKQQQVAASKPVPTPLPRVKVAALVRRDVAESVRFTGTIKAANDVAVYAKVTGRVEKLAVDVGDKVAAGAPLAVLDHAELEWQKHQASAQVQVASAALEQAKLNEAATKTTLERAKALKDKGVIPQADLDQAQVAHDGAIVAVDQAQAQLAAAYSASGLAGQTLANSTIVAPIAGTVTRRMVDLGGQVTPAAPIFQIESTDELRVEGEVTAGELVKLSKGQAATVTVDDMPGKTFPAVVSILSPSLDAQTRRAQVVVTVANTDGKLLPHMFATVSIAAGTRPGALVIPEAAVISTPQGRVVYVLDGGKAKQLRPALGGVDGSDVVVEGGLDEKAQVLVAGQSDLVDGASVEVNP